MPATGPIWLPPTARADLFVCRVCGEQIPLTDVRSQVAHIDACHASNAELLEALSPVQRLAAWNQPPDPEWEDYNQGLRDSGQDPEVQYARGRKSNIRRASES